MKISYQRPGSPTGPRLVAGRVEYVDRPGLGVEIDEGLLGEPLFTIGAPR